MKQNVQLQFKGAFKVLLCCWLKLVLCLFVFCSMSKCEIDEEELNLENIHDITDITPSTVCLLY